jgi:hypothetical protein
MGEIQEISKRKSLKRGKPIELSNSCDKCKQILPFNKNVISFKGFFSKGKIKNGK